MATPTTVATPTDKTVFAAYWTHSASFSYFQYTYLQYGSIHMEVSIWISSMEVSKTVRWESFTRVKKKTQKTLLDSAC